MKKLIYIKYWQNNNINNIIVTEILRRQSPWII